MAKVHINDLARELEVERESILNMLPQVGVTERKTHSSSISEEEATLVRKYFSQHVECFQTATRSQHQIPTKGIDLSGISKPGDVLGRIASSKGSTNIESLPAEHEWSDDFSAALEDFDTEPQDAPGEDRIIRGTVLRITPTHIEVDIGALSNGIVPIAEVLDSEGKPRFQPGDLIDVVRKKGEAEKGYINVSHRNAQLQTLAHISKPGDVLKLITRATSPPPSPPQSVPSPSPAQPSLRPRPAPAPIAATPPRVPSATAPCIQLDSEPRRPPAPAPRLQRAYCGRRHELSVSTDDQGLSYTYQCREANSASEFASFHKAVTIPDIKRLADEASHVLVRLSHQASDRPPDLSALQTAGGELFSKLIPAELAESLNEEKDFAYLVVQMQGELAWVPWELLWNGKEFLCQSFKVARRLQKSGNEFRAAQKRLRKLRSGKGALVLFGDTSDLKADEERKEIEKYLGLLFPKWFKRARTATDVLRELVGDYDVCHFIGHGHYVEERPSDSGWKLPDGTILTCSQIEESISANPIFPLLMFVNSCDSANPALYASEGYVQLLHHAFLRQGVPHYIGTIAKVPDHYDTGGAERYPAAEFAASFYRSLAEGFSIGDALGMTRREFFGKPGAPIWAYYVHYGDPAYRFLDRSRFHPKVALPKTTYTFEQHERTELFVGRFKELHAVREHLEALSRGRSSLLLIAGEAGMGKTALMRRLLSDAVRDIPGVIAAMGVCQRHSAALDAYLPFKTIFRSLIRSSERLDEPRPEANTVGELVATELFLCRQLFALIRPDLEVGPDQVERICAYLGIRPQDLNPVPVQLDCSVVLEEASAILRRISRVFPIVFAIEDLHWADDESLALFFRLARALQDRPILFVGTYRSHSVYQSGSGIDTVSPLQRALSDAGRHGAHTLSLDFQRAAIADPTFKKDSDLRRARSFVISYLRHALPIRSATERPGGLLVNKLTEYSGGNAFIISQLVKSLQEKKRIDRTEETFYEIWGFSCRSETEIELSESVEALLEERVIELSKDLRKTLMFASVEGLQFSLEVLSHLMNLSDQVVLGRLEDLIHIHGIIEEGTEKRVLDRTLTIFHFRNRAIQTYLHQELGEAQQQRLHKRAGEFLEAIYRDCWRDAAASLALHFRITGDLEKALRYTIEAARQMYHSPLNAWDAVAQFNRAKELMRRMPEVDQTLKKKISKESYQAFRFARELDYWTYYGHKLDACMTEDEYELHGGLGDTLHY